MYSCPLFAKRSLRNFDLLYLLELSDFGIVQLPSVVDLLKMDVGAQISTRRHTA